MSSDREGEIRDLRLQSWTTVSNAFVGAESLYLLGFEAKRVPVRQALRRVGDLIRLAERDLK